MTASAGIALNAGVPAMPKSMSAAPPDKVSGESAEATPSFQSEMQDCNSRENTPKVARDSQPKRTGKDNSGQDKKSEKKADAQDQAVVPVPVAVPARVTPLPIMLALLGVSEESTTSVSDAASVEKSTPDAQTIAMADMTSPEEELPQLSSPALEDLPSSSTSKPGELAFAARISSSQEDAAPAATPSVAAKAPVTAALPVRPSGPAAVPQKYMPGGSLTDDAEERGGKESRGGQAEQLFKMNATVPAAAPASQTAPVSQAAKSAGPQSSETQATQALKETTLEPAAPSPTSSHDFRVRVPDNQGGSMDVRFVESGGEVRVSVKTPDNNLAQTLRGQLNQLAQQLSTGGVQTELWQPGSDRSFQGSQQESDSRHGSGGGRREQGQQQESNSNKPRWLEELELSGGTR